MAGLRWIRPEGCSINIDQVQEVEMATCPECAGKLELAPDVEEGEIVVCPDCGVELEVLGVNPIALDLAPEVEEDWGE